MARKSAPEPAKPTPPPKRAAASSLAESKRAPSLASLRGEIDQIDKDLVVLLNRRAQIAVEIGQIKRGQGLDVWSSAREDEVVSRALAASKGPLQPETLRLIFRELMSGSRALQSLLRVACLGPKYSYSHLASVAKFGEGVEHVPVGSIAAVFEEVNRRHVHFGIVSPGEFHRWSDRRHTRHVHQNARTENPIRSSLASQTLSARQM